MNHEYKKVVYLCGGWLHLNLKFISHFCKIDPLEMEFTKLMYTYHVVLVLFSLVYGWCSNKHDRMGARIGELGTQLGKETLISVSITEEQL